VLSAEDGVTTNAEMVPCRQHFITRRTCETAEVEHQVARFHYEFIGGNSFVTSAALFHGKSSANDKQ